MAGKRILTSPTEDDGAVKRLRTDSRSDDDSLPDLTDDQLVVLFTLMLCSDEYRGSIDDTVIYAIHTDDAVMGNIAVLKTLHELRDKGVLTLMPGETIDLGYVTSNLNDRNSYHISIHKTSQVMRRFVKEFLNNDMDKEFFLSVASDQCLQLYANTFFSPRTGQNCPITLMRLIIGSEVERFYSRDNLPPAIESLTEVRNFVLDRCQKENLDPIPWADEVPNERIISFCSASTILQPLQKELLDIPKGARSILFCILLSTGYSIMVENDNWRRKLAEIREKFCMSESEPEDLDTINELVGGLSILRKSGQRVTFTSENIKHKVMAEFVICCLKTDKDYELYLRMTSDDSVIEYCTFWEYFTLTNDRCLYIPSFLTDLLIEKLNLFAVLQGKLIINEDVKMKISGKYGIPLAAMNSDDVTLSRFAEAVIGMGIGRVNLNSVFYSIFIFHQTFSEDDYPTDIYDKSGSDQDSDDESRQLVPYDTMGRARHDILERARQLYLAKQIDPESLDTDVLNQQMYIDGGTQRLSLSPRECAILIYILLADDYVLNIDTLSEAKQRSIQDAFVLLQDVTLLSEIECMAQSEKYDKILAIEDNNIIKFASNEIRHQVMSYFVLNCLKTDEDYNNYIRLSSVDSLLEYVRTWEHKRKREERCLYLKSTMLDNFIQRLGLDAIRHVMVEYTKGMSIFVQDTNEDVKKVRDIVQKNVNIPREIFDWDYEARCRYAECGKKGTQTIHRARAMIVGCAGAGKTTLLKRLRKCSQEEINKVQSTVGLEIHEDIFEIADEENVLRGLHS